MSLVFQGSNARSIWGVNIAAAPAAGDDGKAIVYQNSSRTFVYTAGATPAGIQANSYLIAYDSNATHNGSSGGNAFSVTTSPSFVPTNGSVIWFGFAGFTNSGGSNIVVNGVSGLLFFAGGFAVPDNYLYGAGGADFSYSALYPLTCSENGAVWIIPGPFNGAVGGAAGLSLSTNGYVPFSNGQGSVSTSSAFTYDATAARITVGVTPRVNVMPNSTSFAPSANQDINTQANTQALGTLTANAPTGSTPVNGQPLELVISSTNVQTFAWNAIYVGCTTVALPTATTGATKTDRFLFTYNSAVSKWQIVRALYGFV